MPHAPSRPGLAPPRPGRPPGRAGRLSRLLGGGLAAAVLCGTALAAAPGANATAHSPDEAPRGRPAGIPFPEASGPLPRTAASRAFGGAW
ncbi:hypothetical protein RM780_18825 [Streptomyces sp. DSM 44917]|uniref:Uncharacterized protein n=1 Tax=Streptomyces boetiae TaxID=3075541 RepID=A0ABU2LBV7_9ACTN|nr:hypothetical protein [Streptomyces sp. DSM 44917]MDT0308997.1 hypothetical protein [Streptomyces sp. DSM 44917]